MQKHLYFICPTDHLEPIINENLSGENYFYTSLGNSISFDVDTIVQINKLLEEKNITEITFVLSDQNKMVLDAIKGQDFSGVKGLSCFYYEIMRQKRRSQKLWNGENPQIPILTYYLNKKIEELESQISDWMLEGITINSKIYNIENGVFRDAHFDIFAGKYLSLN